jgi:hypothetical protein
MSCVRAWHWLGYHEDSMRLVDRAVILVGGNVEPNVAASLEGGDIRASAI